MKRVLPVFLVLLLTAPLAQAAEVSPEQGPVRKLQRGFLNIVLSPIEISNELQKEKKAPDQVIPNWITGMGRGIFFTMGRAAVGAYEMITFPIPSYGPVIEPEFPWEHLDPKTE